MIFFSLYGSCDLTSGVSQSCLVDLERATYCSIPNELYSILNKKINISIEDVEKQYSVSEFEIIKKYLSFLENNKFIFYHSKQIDLEYLSETSLEVSYELQDLIIDIKSFSKFKAISHKIPSNIETVQLRFFYKVSINSLHKILEFFRVNKNTNIYIILNYNESIVDDDYIDLYRKYKIISRMVIMGAKINKHLLLNQIICCKEILITEKQCGKVSEKLFSPNMRTYLSSKSCNSCLNSKISIDINGRIKNCPSMRHDYGSIESTSIEEVLEIEDFKKNWKITKDQIDVCKDCEFRYICTDCRAYLENPKDIFSKPLKCGYDPYTNIWENWSINPLKQRAIKFYGMEELLKK
ncbi:grasp-with-spasm system SPASM domain peptide maturase [Tenacibaculum ovolyticum]|uniref:grasp-with-spasm system SPASM domain peptide maturase n=1 Tax=Tenacibaculum ovolyticum TaxID=104270 RepID=UPI0007ED8C3B|nr:grasp-with-spasm system SPASM domain peptide maturase [Tenacibaculum ovolyticum]